MATLTDFADTDPLRVHEHRPIVSPIQDKILGFAGPSNRDQIACVCETNRYNDSKGRQHYFRKIGGYTFAKPDIRTFEREDIDLIVIEETDNDRVLEFTRAQFENGVYGGEIGGVERLGVPVEKAQRTWDRRECEINKANHDRR